MFVVSSTGNSGKIESVFPSFKKKKKFIFRVIAWSKRRHGNAIAVRDNSLPVMPWNDANKYWKQPWIFVCFLGGGGPSRKMFFCLFKFWLTKTIKAEEMNLKTKKNEINKSGWILIDGRMWPASMANQLEPAHAFYARATKRSHRTTDDLLLFSVFTFVSFLACSFVSSFSGTTIAKRRGKRRRATQPAKQRKNMKRQANTK